MHLLAIYGRLAATAQKTKLKHIDCRQEWVRTLRNKDICNPVHIPTKDNLSDIFTKILSGPEFERLRAMCMKEHDIVNWIEASSERAIRNSHIPPNSSVQHIEV